MFFGIFQVFFLIKEISVLDHLLLLETHVLFRHSEIPLNISSILKCSKRCEVCLGRVHFCHGGAGHPAFVYSSCEENNVKQDVNCFSLRKCLEVEH